MKKLLLKNSLTGVAQSGLNLILLIVAVPLFIKLLGSEAYGAFSLIMIAGNLNTFTNLGLSQALLKFLAEQGQGTESDHDIWVSVLLLLFVATPLLAAGTYFWQFILVNLFGLHPSLAMESKWLLFGALFANFFIMLGQVPKAILDSLQKIFITSWLQALYSTVYWGLIIFAVTHSRNLDYVGMAVFAAALIWFIAICSYALVAWRFPSCKDLSGNISRVARKQLSYGGQIYTGGLISFFFEPLTKIMISHLLGVVYVGYFDIVLRIKAQAQAILAKFFAPLMPLLAKWGNSDKTKYLIHDLEKKILLITIPFSCIFYFTISPFLNLWLGDHSPLIDMAAKIIIPSFILFSTSSFPAYVFFLSCGYPQNTIYIQLTNTVVNIVVLFILYKSLGFISVPISSAVAISSSFLITLYFEKQILYKSIISEHTYVLYILGISTIIITIGLLSSHIIRRDLLSILIIPTTILTSSLIIIRSVNIISEHDVNYYFGKSVFSTIISNLVIIKK